MREIRSYGSVRGVPSNRHPYRDSKFFPLTLSVKSMNTLKRNSTYAASLISTVKPRSLNRLTRRDADFFRSLRSK